MTSFFSALPVALLLTATALQPLHAAEADQQGSAVQVVGLGDLDLTQDAGQQAARARLRLAAVRVCDAPAIDDLRDRLAADACREQALADANTTLTQRIGQARSANTGIRLADARR